jgi:tetratricopeptide (TPR) repeat protein
LLRCLAWDPDVRPASAAEFAAELRSLLSPTRRLRRWAKRHARALAAAMVLTAVPAAAYVATMPPAAVRHAQTGEEHYREGRYDLAIKAFDASLAAESKQPEVLFKRGRAHMKAGDYQEALEDLRDPILADHPRALATCGYLYSRDEKTDHTAAIEHYKLAIGRGFENAIIHNDMAYSYQRSALYPEAVKSANKALDFDVGLRAAHYNRALAQLSLAEKSPGFDLRPGLEDIRQVLERGPLSAVDYWWAGKIASKTIVNRNDLKDELLPEAALYFRKAVEKGWSERLEGDHNFVKIPELRAAIADAQPREVDHRPPPFQNRLIDPLEGTPD